MTGSVVAKLFREYHADARNVRAALTWCLEHGDPAGGLRICTEFGIYWIGAGASGEGAWWFTAFSVYLDAGEPTVPMALRGPALTVRGQLAYHRGDLENAAAWADAGLEVCRAARDLHYMAIALNVLAQTAIAAGHPQDALPFTDEALELAQPGWDSWSRVFALNVRAEALTAAGCPGEAGDFAAAALTLALEMGHHWGTAIARRRLAEAALGTGDLDTARGYFLAVLPYLRTSMPRPDAARCLADLGQIAMRQGDPARSREYLADSLNVGLRAGSRSAIANTLLGFAELATIEGSPDLAVRLAAAATAQCAAARLPPPGQALHYRDAHGPQASRLWADGLGLTAQAAARLALGPG